MTLATNMHDPVDARHQLRPVLGPPGIMSFGQALFFGVAGYAIALVGRDLDFSEIWGTLPLAMLIGLLLSALFAAFLLLGRKPPTTIFVAFGTLTGSYAAERLVSGWQYVGAGNGLSSVKLLNSAAMNSSKAPAFYCLALVAVAAGLCRRALPQAVAARPGAGRHAAERGAAGLLRLSRAALQGAGVFLRRHGRRAGRRALQLSPGLHRARQHGAGPVDTAVIYCLFGGSGTLIGPIIGTAAIEVLSYVLSDVDAIKQFWPVILGLVLLVVVMFQPKGMLGLFVSDRERIGSYGRAPAASDDADGAA